MHPSVILSNKPASHPLRASFAPDVPRGQVRPPPRRQTGELPALAGEMLRSFCAFFVMTLAFIA